MPGGRTVAFDSRPVAALGSISRQGRGVELRYGAGAVIVIGTSSVAIGAGWSQTSVIQQSVTVNHESSSVTVSGQSVTVDTSPGGAGRVVGDGQPASETRPIGPVAAVTADGAFVVTVKAGPPDLTIETDKNLLPIVKTALSNGRLEIYTDRSYSVDGRIKVTVTSPNISEISASGSNQVTAEGLTGGSLSIALNGSNNAVLNGNVSTLTVRMSGANHLSAQQLSADSAKVTVDGSGNATVNAGQQIVAEISGAGSVTVHGNPKARNIQVSGAGKINFID